ncbi:MAG: GNAT family N-acetyltransferase [Muribaculaceae bacterium]|nr:GNAT family N-acetyltransferase [Muribaculaceae bacterium]
MDPKSQIIKLWKDTFHDTDEYVSLVFTTYYNEDNCFFKIIDNNVVSAMLCIPYNIVYDYKNIKNHNIQCIAGSIDYSCKYYNQYDNQQYSKNKEYDNKEIIQCAYQCGLSTKPDYRRRGIMYALIDETNRKLLKKGFALSILIPSNEHNKLYYTKSGYRPITFIRNERYTSEHIFIHDFTLSKRCSENIYDAYISDCYECTLYDINNIIEEYKNIKQNNNHDKSCDINNLNNQAKKNSSIDIVDYKKKLFIWYNELFKYINGCRVEHSFADFKAVLEENFISGGKILVITNRNSEPLGMLFCCYIEEDDVTIQLLVSESEEAELILLQALKSFIPQNANISLRRYNTYSLPDISTPKAIGQNISPLGSTNIGNHLTRKSPSCSQLYEPYKIVEGGQTPDSKIVTTTSSVSVDGLQKSYAMAKILNVAEVLKFAAKLNPNSEFSILITHDEFKENEGFYSVKAGKMEFIPMEDISEDVYKNIIDKCSSDFRWYNISVNELASFLFRPELKYPVIEEAIAIPRLPINIALMLD